MTVSQTSDPTIDRHTISIEAVTPEIAHACAAGARVAVVARINGGAPHVWATDAHWARTEPHKVLQYMLGEVDMWAGKADIILPGLDAMVALGGSQTAAAMAHLTAPIRWTTPLTINAEHVQPGWQLRLTDDSAWLEVVEAEPCADPNCPLLDARPAPSEDCTRIVMRSTGFTHTLHKPLDADEVTVRIPAEVTP